MPAAPFSQRELDAYREQADRFIAELDEEAYLHYSGQKDTYELAPIYERHAALTAPRPPRTVPARPVTVVAQKPSPPSRRPN